MRGRLWAVALLTFWAALFSAPVQAADHIDCILSLRNDAVDKAVFRPIARAPNICRAGQLIGMKLTEIRACVQTNKWSAPRDRERDACASGRNPCGRPPVRKWRPACVACRGAGGGACVFESTGSAVHARVAQPMTLWMVKTSPALNCRLQAEHSGERRQLANEKWRAGSARASVCICQFIRLPPGSQDCKAQWASACRASPLILPLRRRYRTRAEPKWRNRLRDKGPSMSETSQTG